MCPMFSQTSPQFTPSPPRLPWRRIADDMGRQGWKNNLRPKRSVLLRCSPRGRRLRSSPRLPASRKSPDHHLHGLPRPGLLMIPNMYKIAGELLPGVFHVPLDPGHPRAVHLRRSLRCHGYTADGLGHALLLTRCRKSWIWPGVAHLSAIKGRVPFLHFFDGFRALSRDPEDRDPRLR